MSTAATSPAAYAGHLSNGDPTHLSTSYAPTHPGLFHVSFATGSYNSSLVTDRAFKKGETMALFKEAKDAEGNKKRYSTVQVERQRHIELCSDLLYINHSCSPLVRFDVSGPRDTWRAVAERDIAQGEALSFFYPSTEWSMAQPFHCTCGSQQCLGWIDGAEAIDAKVLQGYFVNAHISQLKTEQTQQQQQQQ